MARSRTGTFADADHYQQAERVSRTELFVAAAGRFHGELTAIDLQTLADAATAKALEQDLRHATIACLGNREAASTRQSWRHAKVIVRFEEFLASKRYEPVYIAEICSAIGVSERTLRTCCHEHFGMGPVR